MSIKIFNLHLYLHRLYKLNSAADISYRNLYLHYLQEFMALLTKQYLIKYFNTLK